jgi:NADH-quinone oxidoreductase subunit N
MAPFHVWTPDVYEGAPTPVTGFMAAGPKAAAFASFLRIFVLGLPLIAGAQASVYLHETWVTALTVMAMITIIVGNVAAIMQNNVKRMLAYSSIAHAGYALVGFVGAGMAKTDQARDAAIAAVAFSPDIRGCNLGHLQCALRPRGRRTEFDVYNGIGFSRRFVVLAIALCSRSTLPLTAGSRGEVLVFARARPEIRDHARVVVAVNTANVNTTRLVDYVPAAAMARTMPAAMAAAIIITIRRFIFRHFQRRVIEIRPVTIRPVVAAANESQMDITHQNLANLPTNGYLTFIRKVR